MLIDFLKLCNCVLKDEASDYSDVLDRFQHHCSVSMLPIVTFDLWPVYALECGRLGEHLPRSHNGTYIVPLDIRDFWCLNEVSALLSAFYNDRDTDQAGANYGAEIEEAILLYYPKIKKTMEIENMGAANVIYVKLSFGAGNTAQLFLIMETPEFCWTELYEAHDISMDILIHSNKGLGNWFPRVKLFPAMCATKKPALLPRFYFEGKYVSDAHLFHTIRLVDKVPTVREAARNGAAAATEGSSTVWEIDLSQTV